MYPAILSLEVHVTTMDRCFVKNMHDFSSTFQASLVWINWFNFVMSMSTTMDSDILSPFDSEYEIKRTPKEIKDALIKHKIIPDVLDKAPNETIYVEWIDGPCAEFGNEIIALHEIENQPLWVNNKNFLKRLNTIIMIGPDEPSPQNRSSSFFLYWLVTNIPPHDYDNVPATAHAMGEKLVEYREPMPPRGTGLHRYVFLAFSQGNRTINVTMPKLEHCNVTQRLNFNLKKFVKRYDLGEPFAVNFFLTQWHRPIYLYSTDEPTSEPTTFVIEHFSEKSGGTVRVRSKRIKEKFS
nr:PREDICTED: protein FLOWERING LOCUS T-like isoform X3 [Bemisia tabaci]